MDVHIFNIKNKVERGVELKFSPLGASRGRRGRRRGFFLKKSPSPVRGCGLEIYILGAGSLGGRGGRSQWC